MSDEKSKLQRAHEELVRRLSNWKTQSELEQIEKALEKNEAEQRRLSARRPRPVTERKAKRRNIFQLMFGGTPNDD